MNSKLLRSTIDCRRYHDEWLARVKGSLPCMLLGEQSDEYVKVGTTANLDDLI